MSVCPPHLALFLHSLFLCTVLITLNIFMLWFWLLHEGECCLLEQSSRPIHSRAIVLGLQPRCIAKLPSYRCYLLCLCHTWPLDCRAVCMSVCAHVFEHLYMCFLCLRVHSCYTAPSVPHFFVSTEYNKHDSILLITE